MNHSVLKISQTNGSNSNSANSIMHAMSCPVFNQMNSYTKIILKNDNAYLLTKNASYYEQLAVRWR